MNIKQLAQTYLQAITPAQKNHVLSQVQDLLNQYDYKSYNKALKDFQFSYFGGLNSSSKIVKGMKYEFSTLVLYLSASNNAGKDLCRFACSGCRLACLVESGRAFLSSKTKEKNIQVSRLIKSWIVIYRKDIAIELLSHEIAKHSERFENFAVRLNGTSDLDFYEVISRFPNVQFYDYTKDPNRTSLDNYHLTFSYSTMNKNRIEHYKTAFQRGQRLAIPVVASDYERILSLSNTFDMDSTDLRFLDGEFQYGILKAKTTSNLSCGIKDQFILNYEQFLKLRELIEA